MEIPAKMEIPGEYLYGRIPRIEGRCQDGTAEEDWYRAERVLAERRETPESEMLARTANPAVSSAEET